MTTEEPIPYRISDHGEVMLHPADLERLTFGPALTLDQAAQVMAMTRDAQVEHDAWVAAEERAAVVIDLDTERQARRADRPEPGRNAR